MTNSFTQPDPDDHDDETLDAEACFLHDLGCELPAALDAPPTPDAGDAGPDADESSQTAMLAQRTVAAVSGLNKAQRARARELVAQAAFLGLSHASELHYTQDARRWEGIAKGYRAWRGQFPRYADCSSFATWVLWQGLGHFHLPDIVNGQNWKQGYTCTMTTHGRRVVHRENLRVGDLVLYGQPCAGTGHVAIYVGGGEVISHGSEGGPYRLRYDYRPIHSFRRYI